MATERIQVPSEPVTFRKQEEYQLPRAEFGKKIPASEIFNIQIKNLVRGQELVMIEVSDTVEQALARLGRYRLQSAPVYRRAPENVLLGFVDVLDILAYLVHVCGKLHSGPGRESWEISTDTLHMMKQRAKEFNMTQVGELIDFSKRNRFAAMRETATVRMCIDQWLHGVHRVACLDNRGWLTGVLSQFSVVEYLALIDPSQVKELQNTAGNFIFKTENPLCIGCNTSVIDAFMVMHNYGLSALGLLDTNGKLVGNISASDLKGLTAQGFNSLLLPCESFLQDVRSFQRRGEDFVVWCTHDTPMHQVVNLIVQHRVHRIYVCTQSGNPLAVISLTDLLKAFSTLGRIPTAE